ncbi:MAG: hypothetical protein HFI48_11965 [Lachnospiraceae bacterium]|nr:hypothetical protein [Lachnospiraceae bacterium]
MAIEALSTAWSDASLFNREHGDQDFSFKGKGSMSALQWLADAAPDLVKREQREPDPFTAYEENRAGEAGGPLSYSRRITANIRTGGYRAGLSENRGSRYAYQASIRQYETIIRVNGDERCYLIRGIDDEGKLFEKEFDPYEVDPESTDYTEFTALCLYIQRTEKYADSIMSDADKAETVPGKPDCVSVFGKWENMQAEGNNKELLEGTMKLQKAIQEYFDNQPLMPGAGQKLIDFAVTKGEQIGDGT